MAKIIIEDTPSGLALLETFAEIVAALRAREAQTDGAAA